MNVAVKTPIACQITRSRAIQSTRRGEYAVALNCTITNASEKTIAVSEIMPDAIEEPMAKAAPELTDDETPGSKCVSIRGNAKPPMKAISEYSMGMPQLGICTARR